MSDQQDQEFYSSLGARYEQAFAHDQGFLDFIQRLLGQLPANSRVLDAGCGTGKPLALSLANAGHEVTGIDISQVMVDLSSKAVPSGRFQVADMREWSPPSDTHLDAVLNILSLFLLSREEIESMADKWASWLNIGGFLAVCSIPAEEIQSLDLKGAKRDSDGLCVRDIPFRFMGSIQMLTLFTRDGWHKLLQSRGFEIVDQQAELFEPPAESESDAEVHYFVIAKKVR